MIRVVFFILFMCLASNSEAQVNWKGLKESPTVFDCQILKTVLGDSTIFKRKTFGQTDQPFILNDFRGYFKDCSELYIYGRPVRFAMSRNRQCDTLTILYIEQKSPSKYEIDFYKPSSGSHVAFEVLKKGSKYKITNKRSGEY